MYAGVTRHSSHDACRTRMHEWIWMVGAMRGLTRAVRPPARSAVRLTVPQHGCAARCVRLAMLRGVNRLHRAARVLAEVRACPCTARVVCDHAVSAREGQTAAGKCDRAPVDSEDGVIAARCTTSLASLPPSVPRRAWQFANWVSQLLTSDATRRGIWARHTTPNVTSATRIAARLLQRTGDQSAAAMAKSLSCSEEQMRLTSVSAYG
jgi:hypothetical protein